MKSKILFVVALLNGLLFTIFGLNKFLNFVPTPPDLPEKMKLNFEAFMQIGWLMPLVGFGEVLGGILLIIPKTRALGAIVLFPIVVGILLTHLFVDLSGLPMALFVTLSSIWIIFENKDKYMPMIK